LTPFDPHEGSEFRPPTEQRLLAFQEALIRRHYTAIIRRSKGSDISRRLRPASRPLDRILLGFE